MEEIKDKLDPKIVSFLKKLAKKDYSEQDITDAEEKADSKYKSKLSSIWDTVRLLFHIAKHPGLWGRQAVLLASIGVIYLVTPIDVVPDIVPGAGLIDDAAVITSIATFIFKGIKSNTKEKKLEIRKQVPEDLLNKYDELVGLSEEDLSVSMIQSESDLGEERKKRIFEFSKKLGEGANEDDIKRIDNNLDSMNKGPIAAVWDKVQYLWSYYKENVSAKNKIIIIGALLYLILPIDVIPDSIPVAGLIDDLFIINKAYYILSATVAPVAESFIKRNVRKAQDFALGKADIAIEWAVKNFLDQYHYKRLSSSLINLLIYLFAILFSFFPIFGAVPSAILSSALLLASLSLAIYRFVKMIRNRHTIPLIKTILKEKDIKRGLASYIRSLNIKSIVVTEKTLDFLSSLLGEAGEKRFIDKAVDHSWILLKKTIFRFISVQAIVVLTFFIMRHALLLEMTDIGFLEIILYPFNLLYLAVA